ncbi:MAG TPA: tRNA (uridine(34)/cytosine(34)/5-carboxymethylaminomethyluridine(34)-2'-O)-methyltransferase TrmL [Bacillota bacterium]|jgi:tRNA (cytidine/uridine-2'-O-)-methyltransferase|nr:tRNA (uridine(34)/cytosine(34)/5-carboxymethylaminomethyluridine(34)-2'-O)-methyltransferase TrmL [Bacillota bacterium]HOL08561.1 tRNA (uridine(34)/cytosine(34)/5-carboxymethylaminomethyluridine(34)-2'-O)-methyltransferase TrmL [Bacillota bacterium]HPO96958.1 tRNA (uridine(34)/cytosine(34)/5-carboxymethylaminomethyluridine(34)-2'-O)-methyltransferase TrmL [Bacillota bacterium]
MHVVLYQPEIPQNTGNIARLCAATKTELHLIEPFGFIWDDQRLKRAGLDYWELVNIQRHLNFQTYLEKYPEQRLFFATTKGGHPYTAFEYQTNDSLVFGPETRGLPEEILKLNPSHNIRIPMQPEARSLNLANSVSIILYEALRQMAFPELV